MVGLFGIPRTRLFLGFKVFICLRQEHRCFFFFFSEFLKNKNGSIMFLWSWKPRFFFAFSLGLLLSLGDFSGLVKSNQNHSKPSWLLGAL